MSDREWVTGPVAITGAGGHVGRGLQSRLARLPNEVRPLGRDDDWALALSGVAAVVHLAGTLQPRRPDTYETANLDTTRRLLRCLHDTPPERIVSLSYVGADARSDNDYLRTKGEAEEFLLASGIPTTILRSTLVYGKPDDIGPSFSSYRSSAGKAVSVLGDGTQRLAPIRLGDLTEILARACLDPAAPTGIFEIGGPDTFTMDEFVRSINGKEVKMRHLSAPAARLLARFSPQLTPALVEVMTEDSLPSGDPGETAGRFGITLRHVPVGFRQ